MQGNSPDEEYVDEHGECAAEITRLRARVAELEDGMKHYADGYCEGWCKEAGGKFDDCGGCRARSLLDPPPEKG